MVEYSVAGILWLTFLLTGLQYSLFVVQYLSVQHVARDTARWAAIHPDSLDSTIEAHAEAINLPGAGPVGIASVAVNPSCTALVDGVCVSRPSGNPIIVTVTPNAAAVTFLPTSFNLGLGMAITLPTSFPAARAAVNVE